MSLKLVQLPLHLSADETHTLIDFLGQLLNLLWASYCQQIEQACRTDTRDHHPEPDFDDPSPF